MALKSSGVEEPLGLRRVLQLGSGFWWGSCTFLGLGRSA